MSRCHTGDEYKVYIHSPMRCLRVFASAACFLPHRDSVYFLRITCQHKKVIKAECLMTKAKHFCPCVDFVRVFHVIREEWWHEADLHTHTHTPTCPSPTYLRFTLQCHALTRPCRLDQDIARPLLPLPPPNHTTHPHKFSDNHHHQHQHLHNQLIKLHLFYSISTPLLTPPQSSVLTSFSSQTSLPIPKTSLPASSPL